MTRTPNTEPTRRRRARAWITNWTSPRERDRLLARPVRRSRSQESFATSDFTAFTAFLTSESTLACSAAGMSA